MSHRLFISLFGIGLCLCVAVNVSASTQSTAPITTSADVPVTFALNLVVQNTAQGQSTSSIEFGNLVTSGDILVSTSAKKVTVAISANGSPFSLVQTATDFSQTGGSALIPAEALVVEPLYETAENGGLPMPGGASLGSAANSGAPVTLYADPSGQPRTLSLFYSLDGKTATGEAVIPLDQPSGNYAGSLQFTLVQA